MTGGRERMMAGLDVDERRLPLAGVATAVTEAGAGPPLVLLHGGIECGGAYWAPVVPALAERHRLIVPDVPGLGESEPAPRLDLETFTDWFAALVARTCEREPVVIAHSLLGNMAARLAARRADLLRRLVVYGAPGIGPYRIPFGLRLTAIRFGLRPTARNAERFDRWAFFDLDHVRGRDGGWFDAFDAYTRSRAAVPHVKATMRRLIGSCATEIPDAELRHIDVPTTLLWGRHDRFVAVGHAEAASARLGWPLRIVDDAGHVPHVERPGAFVTALGELTR